WWVRFAVGVFRLGGCGLPWGFSPRRLGRSLGWRFSASHHSVEPGFLFITLQAGRKVGFCGFPLGWFVAPCLQRDVVGPGRRDGASLTGRRLYWVIVVRQCVRYCFKHGWAWGNFYCRRWVSVLAGSG